jgi:hypothetical protein
MEKVKIVLVAMIVFSITLIQTSCTSNFNPRAELASIEKIIKNGKADSISGHNEEVDFKYWTKEAKIIKLSIIGGNYECFTKDEYFFKEDGVVFANKTSELCLPNAANYKAFIIFDNTNVLSEEYWLEDKKVSKSHIQKRLDELGYSIEENILKDQKTKKNKGQLTLKDFDEIFNLKVEEEEKILFFEQHWGPYENQKTSYKFTIKGTNVDILYNYANNPSPIEKAKLKDGKIITEYGYSNTYVITSNSLCVPNVETEDGSDCFAFIRAKSTHNVEDALKPQ